MSLLRLISWPYFRRHVLRTMLTMAAVVLGVTLLVGMRTANESVLFAFSRTVDRIAGKTELQVSAGEAGFPEEVLERIQSASTVRVAVPVVEAIAATNLPGGGSLYVLGVDMTGDRSLRDYDMESGDEAIIEDALIFLAQPDSIMLSRSFADAHGLAAGDRLTLQTVEGEKPFAVRGLMSASGLASAFGGNLAVMDIYAAQKMFGRGYAFDRIDLAVARGSTLEECQQELRTLLGPGFDVDPPSSRGQQFESLLSGYALMMTLSSVLALLIGMFIIYNSFLVAVSERRSEIGVLRALGASRGQIRRIFLQESALIGGAGALAGMVLGVVLARAMAAYIGTLIADVYGVAQRVEEVAASPVLLAAAVAIGIVTSLAAAAIPAAQAARIDPVRALKKGESQAMSSSESRQRVAGASILGILSLVCLTTTPAPRIVFYAGYLLALAAILAIAPIAALTVAQAIRPVLRWMRPVEGALAADSLIASPRRTSASVTALALSIAMVVAFEGMARASYGSIVDWMETALNPDLFVLPSPSLDVQTVRFPNEMTDELAGVEGIERVQAMRTARVAFRDTRVMAVSMDMASLAETDPRPPVEAVEGDARAMYAKAAAGDGLIVSEGLAQLQGLGLGDEIDLSAPEGSISLPVVGVVLDYSDQQGSILMDRALFTRFWKDDSVNTFRIYLAPGANVSEVRAAILNRFEGTRQVFVMTNTELKRYVQRVAGQWFGLTTVQVAVAVLVGILGIVNTLTVSITDRRRELGVLRAVGARHGQVRRTIWMEALAVAVVALVLGVVLGAANLHYVLQMVHRDVMGVRLEYQFPVSTVVMLVPLILSAAFGAALWPAESAVRGSLVDALEYE